MKKYILLLLSILVLPNLAMAQLRLSLKDLDFGFIPSGESDQEIMFLRNGSKEIATDIFCEIDGDQEFSCQEDCRELRPSGSCTITITFAPIGPGKRSARAYIKSKNMDPVKLRLRGQGYDAE